LTKLRKFTNNETGVSLAILREKTVKCQREPVNKVSL